MKSFLSAEVLKPYRHLVKNLKIKKTVQQHFVIHYERQKIPRNTD